MNDTRILNNEQKKAVTFEGKPLLIIAGAGTGKTTVITERIKWIITQEKAKASEILALTFTEKASREMQERVDIAMPYGYTQMWISTFHSFADRILRDEAVHIGLNPSFRLMTEAQSIKFFRDNLFSFNLSYFRPLGNPNKFIVSILTHFSRLKDEDIEPIQYLKWAKSQTSEEKIEKEKYLELATAYKKYEELKVKEGVFDFSDLIGNLLTLFRKRKNLLSSYKKKFKYILVDEFQDTNIAQYELIKLLTPKGLKPDLSVVGDDNQCLPPDAKISTPDGQKKIKDIRSEDSVITAVGKGHTSISKVTKVFRQSKRVRLITLKTEDGKKITVTDNHKMFGFMPAHYEFQGRYFVYLMYQESFGWRLGITKNPPARLRLEPHADKILLIGSYKTEQEARFYESYFSSYYGIPTVPFSARPFQSINGQWLTRLFKDIDTNKNAQKLASDLHIELDSPHIVRSAVTRGISKRIKVNLLMCYRNYRSKTHKNGYVGNPSVLHIVFLETSNSKTINKLKSLGYHLEKAKKGALLRFTTTNLSEAWGKALKLIEVTNGILDKKFSVGLYNYQHLPARIMPASHVFPGMYLPVLEGKKIVYKLVVSRKVEERSEEIYDLEVEKTHNFIADGVVVHNSIYKFRGAAISNILSFQKDYKYAKTIVLNKNYRSLQPILDDSYRLIKHNDPDTLEAKLGISKKLKSIRVKKGQKVEFIYTQRVEDEADEVVKKIIQHNKNEKYKWSDFAILVRANNHSEPFIRSLIRQGIPYQFLGPGILFKQNEIKDLISYLKVLKDPTDSSSFYRVLTMDIFNTSGKDLALISSYCKRYNLSLYEGISLLINFWFNGKELGAYSKYPPFISDETKEKLNNIINIYNRHLDLVPKESAGQILFYFLEKSGLLKTLTIAKSEKDEQKTQNIAKFFNKLKTYEVDNENSSVSAVVDWIDLAMELGESPLANDTDWVNNNAVNILTVHASKGLEFPVVFLVNLVSQRFPSLERKEKIPLPDDLIKEILPEGDYHLEEERRLFYVGMTRARDLLYFSASNFYGEGKREKKISPFVYEVLGEKEFTTVDKKDPQLPLFSWEKKEEIVMPKTKSPVTFLSYSQIQTFGMCPLHYKLRYILKVPIPPSSALSFGTTIHATLRDFYQATIAAIDPSSDFLYSLYEKNWVGEGYVSKQHEKHSRERGLQYLKVFFEKSFDKKNLPVALETPFIFPVSNNLKFGGKIDRIDKLTNGRIEIIDYKTSSKVPTQKDVDRDMQMTFYALAATEVRDPLLWKKPEEVILSLYYFEDQIKISTTRTKEQLEEAKTKVIEIAKKIETSDFKCSGTHICANCEYKMYCEVR